MMVPLVPGKFEDKPADIESSVWYRGFVNTDELRHIMRPMDREIGDGVMRASVLMRGVYTDGTRCRVVGFPFIIDEWLAYGDITSREVRSSSLLKT